MRERVELLLGRRTRAMWVMTFHSACARMLRAEAPRLGYSKSFTIYDQADSRRQIKRVLDDLGVDPKRYTPARDRLADLRRQEQAPRRRRLPPDGGLVLRADRRRRLRPLRARDAPLQRDGLRRPARARGQRARAVPGGPRALRLSVPPRPRRRVPGHQPRPVPLAAAAGRRAPQPGRGRRRRSVPGGGHAGDHGRRHPEPDRGRAGGRRGAVRATGAATSSPPV